MARERDKEDLLMLVCVRCGSQSVVYDRQYVVGTGWVYLPKCLKCGRERFEEVRHEEKQHG